MNYFLVVFDGNDVCVCVVSPYLDSDFSKIRGIFFFLEKIIILLNLQQGTKLHSVDAENIWLDKPFGL